MSSPTRVMYVPKDLAEARRIIPSISASRFEEWCRSGHVGLTLRAACMVELCGPASITVDGSYTSRILIRRLAPTELTRSVKGSFVMLSPRKPDSGDDVAIGYMLTPQHTYMISTEEVCIPENMVMMVKADSRFIRCGWNITPSIEILPPGYRGEVMFMVYPVLRNILLIEHGCEIARGYLLKIEC